MEVRNKDIKDLLCAIFFILFGIIIHCLTYYYADGPTETSLSPGFFPRFATTCIIGLGLLLVVQSLFTKKRLTEAKQKDIVIRQAIYVCITIMLLTLYIFLMDKLGFMVSTIGVMIALMVMYKGRNWILIILISVVVPVFIYYFSLNVMHVLFPSGILF